MKQVQFIKQAVAMRLVFPFGLLTITLLLLSGGSHFCYGENQRWPDFSCFPTSKFKKGQAFDKANEDCKNGTEPLAQCPKACVLEKLDVWLAYGVDEKIWDREHFPNGTAIPEALHERAAEYFYAVNSELGYFGDDEVAVRTAARNGANMLHKLREQCGPLVKQLRGPIKECEAWKPITDCFDKFGSCTGLDEDLKKYYDEHRKHGD